MVGNSHRVLLQMSAKTTRIITELGVVITTDVKEETLVADKDTAEIHSLEINGPQPTLARNWLSDSGATHHIRPDISSLHHVEDYKGMDQVHVGKGQRLPIHHTGQNNDKIYSAKLQPFHPRAPSHHQLFFRPRHRMRVDIFV
ncbi:hypothetical protein HAX54_010434 [Datura stramonium]|uniref:Uncharacterized protein n=1 Tax=Datura stramonium TaxID=4076 RepID=A0ABS8TI24_DATST|nr:hypothetical protein [Datura stramonium]